MWPPAGARSLRFSGILAVVIIVSSAFFISLVVHLILRFVSRSTGGYILDGGEVARPFLFDEFHGASGEGIDLLW